MGSATSKKEYQPTTRVVMTSPLIPAQFEETENETLAYSYPKRPQMQKGVTPSDLSLKAYIESTQDFSDNAKKAKSNLKNSKISVKNSSWGKPRGSMATLRESNITVPSARTKVISSGTNKIDSQTTTHTQVQEKNSRQQNHSTVSRVDI